MSSLNIAQLKSKRLCHQCIGEPYLQNEVRISGHRRKCSYCGQTHNSFEIDDIASYIEKAFDQHFTRTSDQPTYWQQTLLADRESNYDWERDGEPVIYAIEDAANIPEQAAQDIQSILEDRFSDYDAHKMGEETEFSADSYYQRKEITDHIWQQEWINFEASLKAEARFFNQTALTHLTSVFNEIDKIATADGRPLIIDAGPNTKLPEIYRARIFQSEEKLKEVLCRPDKHLGPPPPTLARAGRMNAYGISVFYGASNHDVAIAEVRPPVGSQVVVARFDIIRSLRLLDLTALESVIEDGSIFDPRWATRLERATFLRSLCQRITRPIMPDDEVLEYLPTQAIADFLATENKPTLDGIYFPSAQTAGSALNIALFQKSARVESIPIPDETEINASLGWHTEDGWETDYSVTELTPGKNISNEVDEDTHRSNYAQLLGRYCDSHDSDARDITLRIDVNSIKVHTVHSVKFQYDSHDVSRHRVEKSRMLKY
ncbi:MAG TPA: RES domain-containing protein [Gallionellaceae bacterium]